MSQSKAIPGLIAALVLLLTTALFLTNGCSFAEEASTDETAAGSANGSSSAAPVPLKLFGRIEELSTGSGAKIPLKMEALVPKRDASLDAKDPALSGNVAQSFPVEFLGTWSGVMTVTSFDYDKRFFEFDRKEAQKQAQLLRAGTRGFVKVVFFRGKDNEIEMKPCSVVFSAATNKSLVSANQEQSSAFGANEVPFSYNLHLGDLSTGKGVTGNDMSCQIMKNSLKDIGKGVMEQEVVTRDSDRNPKTKKVQIGYTENVMRFTRMNSNHLYTQAASVSYGSNAKYQNKVILNGTLGRTAN